MEGKQAGREDGSDEAVENNEAASADGFEPRDVEGVTKKVSSGLTKGKEDDCVVVILSDNEEELPKKTVSTQKQSDEQYYSSVTEKEMKYLKKHQLPGSELDASPVVCTACHKGMDHKQEGAVVRHAALAVPICRKCQKFYQRGVWSKDEDGYYEHCRWCANGGDLLLCDTCPNVFCKRCIRKNLGRSKVTEIEEAEEWQCLVCELDQIRAQRALYYSVSSYREREGRTGEQKLARRKSRQKTSFMEDTLRDGFDVNKIFGTYLQKADKSWAQKSEEELSEGDITKLVVKLRTIVKVTHHNLMLLDRTLVAGCLAAFPGLAESSLQALTIPDEEPTTEQQQAEGSGVAGPEEEETKQNPSSPADADKQGDEDANDTGAIGEEDMNEVPDDMDEISKDAKEESVMPSRMDKADLDEANKAARAAVLCSTSSEVSDQTEMVEDNPLTPRKKLKTKKELDMIRRISVAKAADEKEIPEREEELDSRMETSVGNGEETSPEKTKGLDKSISPRNITATKGACTDSDEGRLGPSIISPGKKREKKPYRPGPTSSKKTRKLQRQDARSDSSDSGQELQTQEKSPRRLQKASKLERLRALAATISLESCQLASQQARVDLPALAESVRDELGHCDEVRSPPGMWELRLLTCPFLSGGRQRAP